MFDVTALGEILIDFTPAGTGESGSALFEQNPGGAPANVLTALARLGQKTAFIGKVGDDMHGRLLASVLRDNGICTAGLIIDPDTFTTLAFVTLVTSAMVAGCGSDTESVIVRSGAEAESAARTSSMLRSTYIARAFTRSEQAREPTRKGHTSLSVQRR